MLPIGNNYRDDGRECGPLFIMLKVVLIARGAELLINYTLGRRAHN